MDWKKVLKNDPTSWLLEDSNPNIKYWALLDLKELENNNPEVLETQKRLMSQPPVTTILDMQRDEGFWVNPEDMYLPKYKATTHQLLILAELGANRNKSIEKGVEHIFKFQRMSGHFLTKMPKSDRGKKSIVKDGCCLDGNILYYLVHFGYYEDQRTQNLIDFIINYHDDENAGWSCRAYPINPDRVFPRNCYMGAIKVLKAFSVIPKSKQTHRMREIIKSEVENILENEIFRYLRNTDGSRKDKAGWKRFGFPLFYQSDALEVLDVLTRLEINDERMMPSINLIINSQTIDGKWLLKNSFNGKMWIDVEQKNQPSKWITLRALRVLKRYFNS